MTITKKLVAGYALPLAFLLGITGVAYWSTSHLVRTGERVAGTHQALNELESLMSTMKDAETGQRGFLLVGAAKPGEENYLEPFEKAEKEWENKFARLRDLNAGDDD